MKSFALWALCAAIIFHALYTNKPRFMFSSEEVNIVDFDSETLVYWLKKTSIYNHPKIISEHLSGYPEYLKREIIKDAYHDYYRDQ